MIAVLLFALVCGALARDPTRCCVEHKLSGILLQLDGNLPMGSTTPEIHDDFIYINYDYDNKRLAIESHALNMSTNQRAKTSIYNDYDHSQQFIFTEDGHCYVKPLERNSMTPPCLPASMVYAGSYDLGSSAHTINTDLFVGMINGANVGYHATHDECSPISMSSYGSTPKGYFITNWVYADVKQNHNTIGAFDMPHACDHPMPLDQSPAVGKRDIEQAYDALNLPYYF